MTFLRDGFTLMHEHVKIDLSGVKKDQDCCLDCFQETVREFRILYEYGVRNILDVTNIGMGRDIKYMQKVEEETGIYLVFSTGFYKEPFFPKMVYEWSAEELARYMIKELTDGVEGTGRKAFVIGEIGTGKDVMSEAEEKVFKAAAIAAVQSGTPVTTHTTLATCGALQADYLISHGVRPDKIVIGHMDLSQDLEAVRKLLEKGVNVGFDTIGKLEYYPDSRRIQALKKIAGWGRLSQVVLSMDITRKSHLKINGGAGYGYLFETFLPKLREQHFTEEQINLLLKDNPKRILEK